MLDWPHLWRDGDADRPVLLMLHGTGGNETEISRLAELLAPGAAVLAPRGRVSENGMNRWFRRLAEGVFDVDDVRFRAEELVAFLAAATEHYGFGSRPVIAVGLSNGANIALAAALLHPGSVSRVVAFSGMFPLDDRALRPIFEQPCDSAEWRDGSDGADGQRRSPRGGAAGARCRRNTPRQAGRTRRGAAGPRRSAGVDPHCLAGGGCSQLRPECVRCRLGPCCGAAGPFSPEL